MFSATCDWFCTDGSNLFYVFPEIWTPCLYTIFLVRSNFIQGYNQTHSFICYISTNHSKNLVTLIPRLHYQPVSSRFSSCALTSPVSTSVCVYITTARTGLNQRQLVRLFHSTVAGSRAVPKTCSRLPLGHNNRCHAPGVEPCSRGSLRPQCF